MVTQVISLSLNVGKYKTPRPFRILNVYHTATNELVVVSKLSPASYPLILYFFKSVQCEFTNPSASVTVQVNSLQQLPVRHYIIGLGNPNWQPAKPATSISSQDEIPAVDKTVCLYTHPFTEKMEKEYVSNWLVKVDEIIKRRQQEEALPKSTITNTTPENAESYLSQYGMYAAAGSTALLATGVAAMTFMHFNELAGPKI